MGKIDARKLTRKQLQRKRQEVIRLFQEKMPVMKIVEETGLSWPAVNAAITRHQENLSLEPSSRGRKQGTGRILSEEQEARLCNILYKKRPWQVGFRIPSGNLSLWNRDAVRQLIEKECGVKLSVRGAAKYLTRWGFPLIKKHQRPRERCSWYIKRWLDANYEELENRAKIENKKIYWVSKKPVVPDKEKILRPLKLSMISALSNQGKEHWLVIKGAFTQKKQINFLQVLVSDHRKPLILIRNNFDYYTEIAVPEKIEVFPPVLPEELAKKEKKKKDQAEEREFRRRLRGQF